MRDAPGEPSSRSPQTVSVLVVGAQYPPHSLGGYELLCAEHVAWLRDRGHPVTVLTSTYGAAHGPETGAHGEHVVRALDFRWRDYVILRPHGLPLWRSELRQRRAVDAAVAESRPGVAVVWHMAAVSKSVLARLHHLGVPCVYVVGEPWPAWDVDDDPWTGRWSRPAARRVARTLKPLVSAVLTRAVTDTDVRPALAAAFPAYASDYLRQSVEAARPEWHGRGTVVRNGVDTGVFLRERQAEEPLGDPLRLLVAGRVEERKGVHTAVETVAALRERGIEARLDVVGWQDEAYAAELGRLARRLGVEGAVRLLGAAPRSDLPDIYRAADVLLFPTIWAEPFGLVPLEAMAAGCVVVATGTGGSGEFLDDGANALLFPARDAAAAAGRIAALVADPGLVARLRRGGDATVACHRFEDYASGLDAVIARAALTPSSARTTGR